MQLDEFMARFTSMEIEEGLFFMRTPDGTPFWDIVRTDVRESLVEYFQQMETLADQVSAAPLVPCSSRILSTAKRAVSMASHWMRLKQIARTDLIGYMCSRYRDANGAPADFASEDAMRAVESLGQMMYVESTHHLPHVLNARYLTSFATRLRPLAPTYKRYLHDAGTYVAIAQRKHFGVVDPSLQAVIERDHSDHLAQHRVWGEILDRSKARLILMTQNGVQKGVFQAARERGVAVIECQHGLIHSMHPVYSYPSAPEVESGVISPDVLLLFSEHWKRQCSLPGTELVVAGNNRFASSGTSSTRTGPVVFASASPFHRYLSPVAIELAISMPDRSFVMKLHPSFLSDRAAVEEEYRSLPNLTVIGVEKSISDLMETASDMVMVESTSGYEALDRQVPIHIMKKAGYLCHQDVFSHPDVHLFSTTEELRRSLFLPLHARQSPSRFFSPFETQTVRDLIKSVLSARKIP